MNNNNRPQNILRLLEKEENFVFLDNARCDRENYLSYLFLRPERIVSTRQVDQIQDCFSELDQALKAGHYVAGFLAYEAGEAFEERLRSRQRFDFPLLWFGIYQQPVIYNHCKADFVNLSSKLSPLVKKDLWDANFEPPNFLLKNIKANISQSSYLQAVAKIKDFIAAGFTYQVNYTFKLKFSFSGSAPALYLNLRNSQSVSYSALIKAGQYFILSFSPELFLRKKQGTILTRPMKGTAKRGRDLKEDQEKINQLANCPKNRSENIMIVDLLRNDLGRISRIGSVKAPRLFNVERYRTLFQMTSDIKSRLKPQYSAFDIFSHIFPSGSVTGAPKIKTMQIIRQLEQEPRRIYTGSIGFFSPERLGTFNVAIRTLLIDSTSKNGEMGLGSGIVYDSDPKLEYNECRLKANFLIKKPQHFQLIETILWQPNKGYTFLALHLNRLEDSAKYFDFLYSRRDILQALTGLARTFQQASYKVRLLLDKNGNLQLESFLLTASYGRELKVCLSVKRSYSLDCFLYHKTTNRRMYEQEYKNCRRLGYCDIIFANERKEITEGAISNIFIRKNGSLLTPPLTCGLLNGVYRRYLLEAKKTTIKETILFKEDLLRAEAIYLSNSISGLRRVYLVR